MSLQEKPKLIGRRKFLALGGAIAAAFKVSEETAGCQTCHSTGKEYDMGQFTNGKMECTDCHDPHQ